MEGCKKTVVFFIDSLGGGGAERVVSLLAGHLASSGRYNVKIVMLRKAEVQYPISDGAELIYAQDMPVKTIYGKAVRTAFALYKKFRQSVFKRVMIKLGAYEKYPRIDQTSFYFYANYAMPYREFLRENQSCTAFGFLIRSNIAMLMAAKGTGVKTVFCERNNPVRPDIPGNIIKIRDKICKSCSAAIFQTEEEREYYTEIKGCSEVIPNPLKEGLPQPFEGERRHEIVNFCRLNKQKNIPLLIEAFELLLKQYPEYTLRIYGRGEEKEKLQSLVKTKNLDSAVFFEDFAEDIHERVRDAAMFAFTSDYEGLSNSMLEAMAIGLPCVCTDCAGGGARMMIQHRENGMLVPVGDKHAVYEAMKEIIEDRELSKKLSREAAKIRERLSVAEIAERWEAMI